MWLLNTKSQELREFSGTLPAKGVPSSDFRVSIPHYAILSHCWREREVLFKDIQDLDSARWMSGFSKILGCCGVAANFGYQWVWVDTCCIDKSSSAELSEAINSMFKWYEHADTCLVYLDDVGDGDPHHPDSSFRSSRWFTRGWTLQELLAPQQLLFFSKSWSFLGSRENLQTLLSNITGIPQDALSRKSPFSLFSVAQRMSWAARRETTRIEDQAYSLMGLFDIFMPIIYGEGLSAFRRLQLEIIQRSNDQTIFAWLETGSMIYAWPSSDNGSDVSDPDTHPPYTSNRFSDILALSPTEFGHAGSIVPLPTSIRIQQKSLDNPLEATVYSWTHLGLHIHLPLVSAGATIKDIPVFIGFLSCWNAEKRHIYGIRLICNDMEAAPQRCHTFRLMEDSQRLVSINEKNYTALAKLAVPREIYILDIPIPLTGPGILPLSKCPFPLHPVDLNPGRLQFSVVFPKSSLNRLKDMGFSLDGYASDQRTKSLQDVMDSGGNILLLFRFPSFEQSPYRNANGASDNFCTLANLLFLNRTANKAFSIFIGFCGAYLDPEVLLDVIYHYPQEFPSLTAQAACNQYIQSHFHQHHEGPSHRVPAKRPAGVHRLSSCMSPEATTVTKAFHDHDHSLSVTSNMWQVHDDANNCVCQTMWVELLLSEAARSNPKDCYEPEVDGCNDVAESRSDSANSDRDGESWIVSWLLRRDWDSEEDFFPFQF